MKSIFLIASILFILNGSAFAQIFSTQNQEITNPVNISSFKFNAKIKEGHELDGFEYASSGRYPFVCQLRINKNLNGVLCSGSLISDSWVLTSRSCIDGAKEILVVCGSAHRGANYSAKIFSSTQSWPTVDGGDYVNIALVQLDQPVTFSKYIKSIRIPTIQQTNFDYTSKNVTALNRFQSSRSSFYGALQSLELTVVPDTSCLVSYSFCSEVTKPEQDFSAGYLGGPAIVKDSDGNDTLIGINYEGIRNAYNGKLQVSINITKFIHWIHHVSEIGVIDRLFSGECLDPDQNIVSPNGLATFGPSRYRDLNLRKAITITYPRLCMSDTGNLILSALWPDLQPVGVWQTNTNGSNFFLAVLDDGSVSIYRDYISSETLVKELVPPPNGIYLME